MTLNTSLIPYLCWNYLFRESDFNIELYVLFSIFIWLFQSVSSTDLCLHILLVSLFFVTCHDYITSIYTISRKGKSIIGLIFRHFKNYLQLLLDYSWNYILQWLGQVLLKYLEHTFLVSCISNRIHTRFCIKDMLKVFVFFVWFEKLSTCRNKARPFQNY